MVEVVVVELSKEYVWVSDSEGRSESEILGKEITRPRRFEKVLKTLYEKGYSLKGGGCGFTYPPWAKSVENSEKRCVFIFTRD